VAEVVVTFGYEEDMVGDIFTLRGTENFAR
jgi:hypothetical protein